MFIKNFILSLILTLLFNGCDEKAMINVYDQEILSTPISCMKLIVSPENPKITNTMNRLYPFKESCPLRLEISYKNGIQCNSTYNVQTKSMGGFPTSYLNMELRNGFSLQLNFNAIIARINVL